MAEVNAKLKAQAKAAAGLPIFASTSLEWTIAHRKEFVEKYTEQKMKFGLWAREKIGLLRYSTETLRGRKHA